MELAIALEATPTQERDRVDRDAGRLLGSRCGDCATSSWPARAVCHRCGSARAEPVRLSSEGRLITHTKVWISRGALRAPFTLGQVELPEGVLVFGHVRALNESHVVPLPVTLVVDDDPGAVPPFWFEPLSSSTRMEEVRPPTTDR